MPSIEILDKYIIDRRRRTPLHIQIEQTLRKMIAQDFENGDIFFKEMDLAEKLGVARTTVRQALGSLSREGLLLRRPSAGTIVTKTAVPKTQVGTSHIGVFVGEYESEYISMLLQKIMEESRHRGCVVHTYYTHRNEDLSRAYRQISHGPDEERLILLYKSHELFEALSDSGYRFVAIEAPSHDYRGSVVATDGAMAVQIGVDYLRSLGHERIVLLVNEPADRLTVQEKIAQFQQALPDGRVVICGTQAWDNSYDAAYMHMDEVWNVAEDTRPTAIMTVSDPGAWAALRWFAEHNIRVPQEVSVLGFEDARSSRFMHPPLSTIAHPFKALAFHAIEMLWQETASSVNQRLVPDLIVRESTGPVH